MQFTPFGVKRVILEEIAQVAIPSRGGTSETRWRRKNKLPVSEM
jgi:hypothetical protein